MLGPPPPDLNSVSLILTLSVSELHLFSSSIHLQKADYMDRLFSKAC